MGPKKFTSSKMIGDLEITFTGEKYPGDPILDTKVEINGEQLCWITWNDKENFFSELESTVEKYRI